MTSVCHPYPTGTFNARLGDQRVFQHHAHSEFVMAKRNLSHGSTMPWRIELGENGIDEKSRRAVCGPVRFAKHIPNRTDKSDISYIRAWPTDGNAARCLRSCLTH